MYRKSQRILALLFCFIMTLCVFSSCAENISDNQTTSASVTGNSQTQNTSSVQIPEPKYTALIYGFSDNAPSEIVRLDLDRDDFRSTSRVEKDPPKVPFVLEDKEYFGEYIKTYKSPSENHEEREYKYQNKEEGLTITYRANANTGEITIWDIWDTHYDEKIKDKKQYSEEECIEIAYEIIKTRNVNVDCYKLDEVNQRNNSYGASYVFMFRPYIGELRISNWIRMVVTCYGDIENYSSCNAYDINEIKNSELVKSIDLDAVKQTLAKKVDECYSNVKYKYEYLYSTVALSLHNGKPILSCQSFVEFTENSKHYVDINFLSIIFLE